MGALGFDWIEFIATFIEDADRILVRRAMLRGIDDLEALLV